MNKKIIVAICLSFICQPILAETCPSVATIKTHALNDWKIYDSDDNKPLSAKRLALYKSNIEEFTLAEWTNTPSHSSIQCYYRDKNGSTLEAYLTKNNLVIDREKKYWYEVSGAMHCAADPDLCQFQKNNLNQQLARK